MNHDITWEDAERLVRRAEKAFTDADIPAILEMFSDSVTARYAGLPDTVGRDALRQLLRARFARQQHYRVNKSLQLVSDSRIVDSWTGEWLDAKTGRTAVGRGLEILRLDDDGLVVELDAVFHGWDPDDDDHAQIT